jgi:hypothetical protein
MVPTLLLLGLVLGRWWRTTLLVAVLGWPLLLLVDGTIDPGWTIAGAAGLAAVNTGIGILVHQGLRWCLHRRPTAR